MSPILLVCLFGSAVSRLARIGAAVLVLIALNSVAMADSGSAIHVWLSTSHLTTTGAPATSDGVPSIDSVNGSTRYVHIWAQPALTDPNLPFATTNPYKQLVDFSLNL